LNLNLLFELELLGYRVVPFATPRVATKDTLGSHPSPFKQTMFFQSLQGILGTSRGVPAGGRGIGGYGQLVKTDQQYQWGNQYFF
jgi:hypothetical protein